MIQPAEHVCAVYATLRCRHLQLSGGCLVCYVFTLFSHEASVPVRKKDPLCIAAGNTMVDLDPPEGSMQFAWET